MQKEDVTHVDSLTSPDQQATGGKNEAASALLEILPASALIGVLSHALNYRGGTWAAMHVPRRIDRRDCFSTVMDRFTREQVLAARDYLVATNPTFPDEAPFDEAQLRKP
jgi:hypothetical protein